MFNTLISVYMSFFHEFIVLNLVLDRRVKVRGLKCNFMKFGVRTCVLFTKPIFIN